jgi:taurine dioxygenase
MRIEQITCNIGAELLDVSLRDAAHDDALFNEIYAALLRHRVLFLRDQDISQRDHVAFASRMGELEGHPLLPSPPDAPGLVQLYKTPDKPVDRYENIWHTDNTWRALPSKACVLRCVECPPVGGDTMWANMVAAYDKLPAGVKAEIADLRANHSFMSTLGSAVPPEKREVLRAQYPDVEHPVVRTHPETGEKTLFVNGFASHFVNYHTQARVRYGQDHSQGGGDLFQYLLSQAYVPEYQVRWRWKKNSVAIWDNRSTQHYAVMDYPPCHRRMDRASVAGDKPF